MPPPRPPPSPPYPYLGILKTFVLSDPGLLLLLPYLLAGFFGGAWYGEPLLKPAGPEELLFTGYLCRLETPGPRDYLPRLIIAPNALF